MGRKWCASKCGKTFYAVSYDGGGREGQRRVNMHALIAGKGCDHRNRDGLDNRRSNLREATRSQQCMNRGTPSNNSSGKTGVSWSKEKAKWQAYIKKDGRMRHLGFFVSLEKAIAKREQAEMELFGEFRASQPQAKG
jgi:hypothetical protein